MDGLLSFFSDLILFTFGIIIALFWLVVIVAVCVEIYDMLTTSRSSTDEEEIL